MLIVLVLIATLVARGGKQKDAPESAPRDQTVSPGDYVGQEGPKKPLDTEWLLRSLSGAGAAKGADIVLDLLGYGGKFELNVEGGCVSFFLVHELEDGRRRVFRPGSQPFCIRVGVPAYEISPMRTVSSGS